LTYIFHFSLIEALSGDREYDDEEELEEEEEEEEEAEEAEDDEGDEEDGRELEEDIGVVVAVACSRSYLQPSPL